ncbi:MAG: ABC transporter substrate-binding protein [Methanosarcinaceae archaeon]|nr:ABC transporter substrate-binding protein [Methanosarcinaceae archaeon]
MQHNLKKVLIGILILLILNASLGAGAPSSSGAEAKAGIGNETPKVQGPEFQSKGEISEGILAYMQAVYLGAALRPPDEATLSKAASAYLLQLEKTKGSVLKIATPNTVKSASLFGDYSLGIFAHLSNPPLMKMDANGKLVGQLVDCYEVSENNTRWTFYLKDELYWSDGKKVSPKDAEFTIRYYGKKTPSARWINDTLKSSSFSEAENSVTFKFNKPYTRINLEFATYNLLPAHIWEKIEEPQKYIHEGSYVGCGPYFLKRIELKAGKLVFERNPYWRGPMPAFECVEIHFYSNLDVATLALENGEVDTYYKYASSYPYPNIEQLKKTEKFDFLEKTNVGLIFLGFNLKKAPLSDRAFREALSYALNYEELVALETLGYGEVANRGFVSPSMEYYKETEKLKYNPAKARELMKKAGYEDRNENGILENKEGDDLRLTLLVRQDSARTAELLSEYLEEIGLEIEVKNVDQDTWFTLKDDYKYDLTVTRSTPWGMLMHASWGSGYFDSRRSGKGVLHTLEDPAFLQLCDELLATTDSAELEKSAHALQAYYAENLPAIPLYWNRVVTPFNRDFEGWAADPLYGIYNLETFVEVRKK